MPIRSQAQWRFLFATDKPFARRWARETPGGKGARFRRLPKKVKAVLERRLLVAEKAGERIAGQLCRSATGKFVNCNSPEATDESKRNLRQQARQQERDVKRQEAIDAMADADAGLSPAGAQALLDFADGGTLSPERAAGLAEMGMVEIGRDGQPRLTAAGRRAVNAMNRGDARAAIDAVSEGTDRAAARQERDAARQQRQQERDARAAERDAKRQEAQGAATPAKANEKKPKGGGGGGGGGKKDEPKPEDPAKAAAVEARRLGALERAQGRAGGAIAGAAPRGGATPGRGTGGGKGSGGGGGAAPGPAAGEGQQQDAARAQRRSETATAVGLSGADVDTLVQAATTGAEPARAAALMQLGFVNSNGEATDQGRRALSAIERGDVRAYQAARQDATAAQQRAADRQQRETARQQQAQERQQAQQQRRAAQEARRPAAEARRAQAESRRVRTKAAQFTVFKDAQGWHRWLAVSSTAFRDKDGEIVSTKALEEDCARADADGDYGPLRWWHLPGVDIGDCDFNAVSGRSLIEMGTFRSAALAEAAAAAAPDLELSIGFKHLPGEPGPDGAYTFVRRFERSLVPRGRAANPYTAFAVSTKEERMSPDKLKAALEKLGTNPEARKAMEEIISAAQTREKEAEAAGVAFKSDDAPPWAQALIDRIGALEEHIATAAAEKAVAPAKKAAMPPAEMIEAGATEAADGAAEAVEEATEEGAEEDGEGMLLTEAEVGMIAERVAQALMGHLDGIASKMAAVDEELKGRGYQRMKEASEKTLPALLKAVKAIEATVNELNGVAPARGHRASVDNDDLPPELAAILKDDEEAIAALGLESDPYASVVKFLRPAS